MHDSLNYVPYAVDINESLPISPHVNVPHSHSFNHIAPPIPPRQKCRSKPTVFFAQVKQDPDAPLLPPRDKSPAAIPSRLISQCSLNSNVTVPSGLKASQTKEVNIGMREHFLMQPNTSTIMVRRNSALEKNLKSDKCLNTVSSTQSNSLSKNDLLEQNLISLSPVSTVSFCGMLG